MSTTHRILVMAHAHPDFSLGGGEIAAYNLFKAYRELPEVEDAWYLGRADRGRGATGAISLRRPNEYLWEQAVHDWFNMKPVHKESVTTWFADLIRALRPSVVHTHHYAHLGLDYLRVIKQVDPDIRIVMTLHEYMAICNNNGQMIKTGSFKLCSRESLDECRQCFPEKTAEDFWLRKHRYQQYFALVDQFVSPSEFLRQRYIDWGIAPEKIVVIENGQSDEAPLPPRPLRDGETRNRFGFFGQINPFKGLDVLLEALHLMKKKERKQIVLEVHGANLEHQPEAYREKIMKLREPLIKEGVVRWVGPYQPHELRRRMAGVDWVVVPSIWWENSPMVIQEAFTCGRPLLVSDIGGMAEKVGDGVDGIHVPAGNSLVWVDKIKMSAQISTWNKMHARLAKPLSYSGCAAAHAKYCLTRS
ncbi:MAG: glycosyltransferase family 4 protein [Candidatus Dactylopiibacterium sp.]|nr:glycosyltransferase family 4 protein [Candidatus Dactylopiibacterium sp.]